MHLITARLYASAVYAIVVHPSLLSVCPSVRHKPLLCRNDWTNRADFWHIATYYYYYR